MSKKVKARDFENNATNYLKQMFGEKVECSGYLDAMFVDADQRTVIGISHLPKHLPIVSAIIRNKKIMRSIEIKNGVSQLFLKEVGNYCIVDSLGERKNLSGEASEELIALIDNAATWAGKLNEKGELCVDLKSPSPGPHFNVNLLMGNRLGYYRPLQTTPKSVVDKMGRGSFRSHAATQVLATRYDARQEENGFPANRQFYLYENGEQIFYSALPSEKNIVEAKCIHSQNSTKITYVLDDGLEICREIVLLPHEKDFPLAVELQRVTLKNNSEKDRNLWMTCTGMFGTAAPSAIFEDVTYTNVIMQSALVKDDEGRTIAITTDYCPSYCKDDERFATMVVRNKENDFFNSFTTNYNDFLGDGTLERPENGCILNNKLNMKGPGFFALGASVMLRGNDTKIVDIFVGLSTKREEGEYNSTTMMYQLKKLLEYYNDAAKVDATLETIKKFQSDFSSYFTLKSHNSDLNAYFNKNLPFQIMYQTFMSRSFCQTQKGYREIGFREIQDVFASMYYFIDMGNQEFVKEVLYEWTANVYEMGYANHNFYWQGKQPGVYSDDSLWLIQAYYRYILYTRDVSILEEEVNMADGNGKRCIKDTLEKIIQYSFAISVGKHGLPLLDYADWNDCLKLDNDAINGKEKERLYREQLKGKNASYGIPFESNYSESVMNAFLLKVAIDNLQSIFMMIGLNNKAGQYLLMSKEVNDRIQKTARKNNFFARVLFNRYGKEGYSYLGASGDGLSADEDYEGVYFLNSFTWAILSDVATEEQIRIMVKTLKENLLTDYGLRLMTPAALNKVANGTASDSYFLGDRENGAVFKHASMMATAALLKAAKCVEDSRLAQEMAGLAIDMVNLILPYNNLQDAYVLGGNPRICTQYINSNTGENIGPLLSGTATWLNLTLISMFGIEYMKDGIKIDPILSKEDKELTFAFKLLNASYEVIITKESDFSRTKDGKYILSIDEKEMPNNIIPIFDDNIKHRVILNLLN